MKIKVKPSAIDEFLKLKTYANESFMQYDLYPIINPKPIMKSNSFQK